MSKEFDDINQIIFSNDLGRLVAYFDNYPGGAAQLKKDLSYEVAEHPPLPTDLGTPYMSPVAIAASLGYCELLELLVERGADPNFDRCGTDLPIVHAIRAGHLHAVQVLVHLGANINAFDWYRTSPLREAISAGRDDVIRMLLEYGVDVHEFRYPYKDYCQTPLHLAASCNYLHAITMLTDNGADVRLCDTRGRTALFYAADSGHVPAIRLLIERGCKVNIQDHGGKSALHIAAGKGDVEAIDTLVELGANVQIQRIEEGSPLSAAVGAGHIEAAETLISHGADVNLHSPLHLAASLGYSNLIALLVRHGAEVNRQDSYGKTPLYAAAEHFHYDAIETLIALGADITIVGTNGLAVLAVLDDSPRSPTTIEILIKHGANVNAPAGNGRPLIREKRIIDYSDQLTDQAKVLFQHGAAIGTESVWRSAANSDFTGCVFMGSGPISPYLDCPNAIRNQDDLIAYKEIFSLVQLASILQSCLNGVDIDDEDASALPEYSKEILFALIPELFSRMKKMEHIYLDGRYEFLAALPHLNRVIKYLEPKSSKFIELKPHVDTLRSIPPATSLRWAAVIYVVNNPALLQEALVVGAIPADLQDDLRQIAGHVNMVSPAPTIVVEEVNAQSNEVDEIPEIVEDIQPASENAPNLASPEPIVKPDDSSTAIKDISASSNVGFMILAVSAHTVAFIGLAALGGVPYVHDLFAASAQLLGTSFTVITAVTLVAACIGIVATLAIKTGFLEKTWSSIKGFFADAPEIRTEESNNFSGPSTLQLPPEQPATPVCEAPVQQPPPIRDSPSASSNFI